jgi:hypothetical protein
MEIWRFLDGKIPQWKVLKWVIGTPSSNGESRVLFLWVFIGGFCRFPVEIVIVIVTLWLFNTSRGSHGQSSYLIG